MVILDEGGMTDDRSLLRLLTAAELARAKVIVVGDDRQLGAIGPGGSMGALLERYGDAVHVLHENVRQVDPDERRALAELRSGDVGTAVQWYAANDRLVARPHRDAVLDDMVAAWATDVSIGRDTALFAWRRANVEELNSRARAVAVERGWVSGPELVAPGGRRYASGDRIVTLAPGADGQLVTSERGRVTAVDVQEGTMTARMDDGRSQRFAPEDTAADRLAYGSVRTMLELVKGSGDITTLLEVVDTSCAQDLTGQTAPSAEALRRSLRRRLDDYFSAPEGWGFATAKRPQSPGVELVKFIRAGDKPTFINEPQWVQAHLFRLEHWEERWVLLELDGPDPAIAELGVPAE